LSDNPAAVNSFGEHRGSWSQNIKSKLIAVLFVMSLSVRATSAQKPFIDWTNLRNPPF
jgi:hypothetical protein